LTVLREFREAKGLTVKEISDYSNIPIRTLYDVENGRKGLVAKRASKIAEYLGEPVETLFFATYYRVKLE
jgi:transcriptional regulator with XRE-family HTH domain